jgi:hypothetical protein
MIDQRTRFRSEIAPTLTLPPLRGEGTKKLPSLPCGIWLGEKIALPLTTCRTRHPYFASLLSFQLRSQNELGFEGLSARRKAGALQR